MATLSYGYDGRHLFSYDGKVIRYEGTESTYNPTGAGFSAEEEMATRLTGSYFLSGRRDPAFNVWADGEATCFVMSYWKDGAIQHGAMSEPGKVAFHVPICLNGPIVRDPEKLAHFCACYPSSTIFACPVGDELAALGGLVGEMAPRRVFLPTPNTEPLPFESQDYDPKLEDDCYGRMARLIAQGMPVLNEIYHGPGSGSFYGKVLCNALNPDEEHPTVIVRSKSMDKYFPDTPLSAKVYAATNVPVLMSPSEEFRDATGFKGERMAVIVSSEFIPGSPEFMRFYRLFGGADWVGVNESVIPVKTMPVFRYNKAYRVPPEDYIGLTK